MQQTEYVLVSQHQPLVEVFTSQLDGRWVLSETERLDTEVVFTSLGCRVAMREIYDRVNFEHGERGED